MRSDFSELTRVKLIDLGALKPLRSERVVTEVGDALGTAGYVDPAVLQGTAPVSAKSDIYALGASLYRWVVGESHLGDVSNKGVDGYWDANQFNKVVKPSARLASLPSALEDLLMAMLETDPEKRPRSALRVAAELNTIAEHHAAKRSPSRAVPSAGNASIFDGVGQSSRGQIKGTSYRTTLRTYDNCVPGGFARVVEACSPELRRFAQQQFLASSWYPIHPSMQLDRLACELLGGSEEQGMRTLAKEAVSIDLHGPYRVFLHVFSTDTVLQKLVTFARQYVDFGVTTTRRHADRDWEVRIAECPRPVANWYCAATAHYAAAVLAKAGAKNVDVATLPSVHAEDTATIAWRIKWS